MPQIRQDVVLNVSGLTQLRKLRMEAQRLHIALQNIEKVKNVGVVGAGIAKSKVADASKSIQQQTKNMDDHAASIQKATKAQKAFAATPLKTDKGHTLRRSESVADNEKRLRAVERRLERRRRKLAGAQMEIDRLVKQPQGTVPGERLEQAFARKDRRAGAVTRLQSVKQALSAERKVLQDELKHQDGLRDRNAQRQAARLAEGAKGYVKASQARTREDGKRITAAENNANRQIYHERRLAKIQQQMAGVSTKLAKTKDATVKNAFQNTQKELAQSKRASTNASFSEG